MLCFHRSLYTLTMFHVVDLNRRRRALAVAWWTMVLDDLVLLSLGVVLRGPMAVPYFFAWSQNYTVSISEITNEDRSGCWVFRLLSSSDVSLHTVLPFLPYVNRTGPLPYTVLACVHGTNL